MKTYNMKKGIAKALMSLFALFFSFNIYAQILPESDIFLMDVSLDSNKMYVSNVINITNRAGYENQPQFLSDNRKLLFVVFNNNQSDIFSYDYINGDFSRITNTPEDEYSPSQMLDGKNFSVVRVEKDSSQRLWKFNLNGENPQLIIDTMRNIGYHEWMDNNRLILFLLDKPDILAYVNIETGRVETIARNIGRSFHLIDRFNLLYVFKDINGKSWLKNYSMNTKKSTDFAVNLPEGVEDFVIAPDKSIITRRGAQLVRFNPKTDKDWVVVHDFSNTPLEKFYRISISPDMKKIALVSFSGIQP